MLSKRARSVLYAVVTEYTAQGEPVGSRTLAKKYGFDLSPATIRNVLADLEEEGYLAQPHTSAGRVPTEKAFRLFIDALMRMRKLSPEQTSRIHAHFDDHPHGAHFLRETSQLLSDLTGAVGVVARPRIETLALRKLQFIPTRPGELLAVLVLNDGVVENRYISVDENPSARDLERLHHLIDELIDDRTISELRDELAQRITQARDELVRLLETGQDLIAAAVARSDRFADVIIAGRANAMERSEFDDAERMRALLSVLEERRELVQLLDRTIASERVQVFLGDETSPIVGFPVSVVAAPYHEGSRPAGSLGVLGSTRMDFSAVVPLVSATAHAMSAALSRDGRPGPKPGADDQDPGDGGRSI